MRWSDFAPNESRPLVALDLLRFGDTGQHAPDTNGDDTRRRPTHVKSTPTTNEAASSPSARRAAVTWSSVSYAFGLVIVGEDWNGKKHATTQRECALPFSSPPLSTELRGCLQQQCTRLDGLRFPYNFLNWLFHSLCETNSLCQTAPQRLSAVASLPSSQP